MCAVLLSSVCGGGANTWTASAKGSDIALTKLTRLLAYLLLSKLPRSIHCRSSDAAIRSSLMLFIMRRVAILV